jgi:hypothetical protein
MSTSPTALAHGGRASQASFTQAISQNHAQKINGVINCASAQECLRLARARIEARRSAEPTDDVLPVTIDK